MSNASKPFLGMSVPLCSAHSFVITIVFCLFLSFFLYFFIYLFKYFSTTHSHYAPCTHLRDYRCTLISESIANGKENSAVLIILFPLLAGGLLLSLTALVFLRRLQKRRNDQKFQGTFVNNFICCLAVRSDSVVELFST